MSFLLRAALVIGALSYLAATRGEPDTTAGSLPAAPPTSLADEASPTTARRSTSLGVGAPIAAVWSAMPADARRRLTQEAIAEFGQHLGTATGSSDTLVEADRKTAWRGADAR